MLEPRRVSKTYEQIVGFIREAIETSQLRPGDRLPTEKELAAQFGVSRPTVREALKVLEALNVLRSSTGPSGGIYVKELDGLGVADTLKDSLAMLLNIDRINLQELGSTREAIEIPVAGMAAIHRTEDDLARLEACITADQKKDTVAIVSDIEFHRRVAECSSNRLMSILIDALHRTVEKTIREYDLPDVKTRSQEQHRRIVEAIRNQDRDEAEAAMRDHLRYANEAYLRARLRAARV